MIENIKKIIKNKIEAKYEIDNVIVEDAKVKDADISIPLFVISKAKRMNPKVIFEELDFLKDIAGVSEMVFLNGFLNIKVNKVDVSKELINKILEEKENFGTMKDNNKTVVIDYSSPNIAKSFGVGHLRSTMIGNALKNIYQKNGYKTVGVNHLGDWGTQFGKMIVAYKLWGSEAAINNDPIAELQKLYVKFHKELETDPSLEQQGRDAFKKLEDKDPEMLRLWTWFREESVKEFMDMYDVLNVSFDSYNGEAFYNDKMDVVIEALEQKKLLKIDDGASIVDLESYKLPPALIKRSDGATLYMTRDLAAMFYRKETYDFDKILYVVGNEQRLHFQQLKAVAELLGHNYDIEHVNFGLVLIDGKKMSTRKGKFKKLADVIDQAVIGAKAAITEKNPDLENKEEVAQAVGVGAIIFNDLKNDRHLEVDFNLDNMLKFEGQTGPYLQYSSVRIASILEKNELDVDSIAYETYNDDVYFEVIKNLANFETTLKRSMENNMPSIVARYLLNLAQSFNSFYGKQKIVVENKNILNANLALIQSIRYTLNEGMRILGITSLNKM